MVATTSLARQVQRMIDMKGQSKDLEKSLKESSKDRVKGYGGHWYGFHGR
jgi:hypothetical protein